LYVNKKRGRPDRDTFPTFYRLNTPRAVRRYAAAGGLDVVETSLYEGPPGYVKMSVVTYLAGVAYERLVNSTSLLSGFRICMIVVLQKPAPHEVTTHPAEPHTSSAAADIEP
jgi:hypothetical protein